MTAGQSLSIVVPIYNEAENLPHLVDRLNTVSERIRLEYGLAAVHYVFIDDGSSDGSFGILGKLDYAGHTTTLLQFSRNFGKEAALSAGIDAATDADAIIMMDADLQHPPELLLDLVRVWKTEEVDSVFTYKEDRRASEGFIMAGMSRGFYWIMNRGARFSITENAGDFRLISRRYANALRLLPESQRFMKGLYGWVGFAQRGLPLTPPPRERGVSSFNGARLLAMSFDAMTSFTTAPLRLMALAGLFVACISALYGVYIVVERLFFTSNSIGIASVLALIAFFGGIQMIFLGLLGEYIGKTVLEAKRRPPYILAERRVVSPVADTVASVQNEASS
ncbi:glycosyltransferase family 2 protein [Shinella zoogloeoides]